MAAEPHILDADSTCATCSVDNKLEYDTANSEMGELITIKESVLLELELLSIGTNQELDSLDVLFATPSHSIRPIRPFQFGPLDDYFEIEDSFEYFMARSSLAAPNLQILSRNRNLDLFQTLSGLDNIERLSHIGRICYDDLSKLLLMRDLYLLDGGYSFTSRGINWDAIIEFHAKPFQSKVGYSYSDYVVLSFEVDNYLSKHRMLDHLVGMAVKAIIDRIFADLSKYKLSLKISQDPECKTPDIRLSIESEFSDFNETMELWEELSGMVEDVIRKYAHLNKMGKDEIENILDTFTISVIPSRE